MPTAPIPQAGLGPVQESCDPCAVPTPGAQAPNARGRTRKDKFGTDGLCRKLPEEISSQTNRRNARNNQEIEQQEKKKS